MNCKNYKSSGIEATVILLVILIAVFTGCAQNMAFSSEPKIINEISISEDSESFNLLVKGNRMLTFMSVKRISPLAVMLYFPETALNAINTNITPESKIIGPIIASELTEKGHKSKIEISLKKDVPYKIDNGGTGFKISFSKPSKSLSSLELIKKPVEKKEKNIVLKPIKTMAGSGIVKERWAVIIGVSEFEDKNVPGLQYCARDAQAFYDWLVSPEHGNYNPGNVRLLLNKDATLDNIKDVLFNWLKQPIEEDLVTIYFAGHGTPGSPDTPDNLYLLPYDIDYDRIASTGFPMWDIETVIKRFVKAKKVVVIADACHSGGIGNSFDIARRGGRGIKVNPINTSLNNLSKVGDGVCVISAAGDREYSQEGKQWGGGHGVFTYYLMKGLDGDSDYNGDSYVSMGELIPYLSEQVRRATQNAQCPSVAGKFDPALTIGK